MVTRKIEKKANAITAGLIVAPIVYVGLVIGGAYAVGLEGDQRSDVIMTLIFGPILLGLGFGLLKMFILDLIFEELQPWVLSKLEEREERRG